MAAKQLRFGPNQESLVRGPNILVDSVDIEFENDFINDAKEGLHTAFAFTQFVIGVIAFGDESSQTEPCNRDDEHENLQGNQPGKALRKNAKHKYRPDIQHQRCGSGSAYTSTHGNPNNRQEEQIKQLVGAGEARAQGDVKGNYDAGALRKELEVVAEITRFRPAISVRGKFS